LSLCITLAEVGSSISLLSGLGHCSHSSCRYEEYPKLKELITLKDQMVRENVTPAYYLRVSGWVVSGRVGWGGWSNRKGAGRMVREDVTPAWYLRVSGDGGSGRVWWVEQQALSAAWGV
jgi:hypothetical protein